MEIDSSFTRMTKAAHTVKLFQKQIRWLIVLHSAYGNGCWPPKPTDHLRCWSRTIIDTTGEQSVEIRFNATSFGIWVDDLRFVHQWYWPKSSSTLPVSVNRLDEKAN